MFKIIFITIFFLLMFVYAFLNLDNFIDVTIKPKKADIIVSLGGDYSGCRLKKALSLYEEGLSKSGEFIYTGVDKLGLVSSRKQFLIDNKVDKKKIIHINKKLITNTMEEIFFIKKYMLYNNLKSVLIVSHPQHSRRIRTLSKYIANYKESGLNLYIASCNPSWWNKNTYNLNDTSFKVTMREMIKLVYNVVKYSPLFIGYTTYMTRDKESLWENFLKSKWENNCAL